jgi:hypothetical protein
VGAPVRAVGSKQAFRSLIPVVARCLQRWDGDPSCWPAAPGCKREALYREDGTDIRHWLRQFLWSKPNKQGSPTDNIHCWLGIDRIVRL